jgi:thiosulfate dehydrogenase
LKAFIIGIVVGVLLVAAGVYVYFISGSAPVAVSAQAMPFERMLAQKALHARVEKEMPKTVPIQADKTAYLAGAHIYGQRCGMCHGFPDHPARFRETMFPRPPQLFRGKGVTDDEPGETYWKVANGIRLTGMPAFKGELSDTEMWQVSLLLANADKISAAVKQQLAPPMFPGGPGASNGPGNPMMQPPSPPPPAARH